MSTILDVLKKVERERQSPRGQLFHAPPHEAKPARRLSPGVIAACAALGFVAGIGLAVWRDTPPTDVVTLPKLPPPPVIDVPAPPPLPEVAVPQGIAPGESTAPVEEVEQEEQVAVESPASAPPGQASSPASGELPAELAVPPASVGPGEAVASAPLAAQPPVAAPPPAPAVAAPPEIPDRPPANSAPDAESVLEPSAFAPARAADSAPAAAASRARASDADLTPPVAAQQSPPDTVAALVPSEPAMAPDVGLPSEATEEPPPPPTTVIDTGRSPPGAPKVSLSFLQWSADPARRFAFVSIDGAPTQRVREGDSAGSLSVAEITPTGVQFKHDGKLFTIRPRH